MAPPPFPYQRNDFDLTVGDKRRLGRLRITDGGTGLQIDPTDRTYSAAMMPLDGGASVDLTASVGDDPDNAGKKVLEVWCDLTGVEPGSWRWQVNQSYTASSKNYDYPVWGGILAISARVPAAV